MSVFGGHFSALFQRVITVIWNQPQPGCWNYHTFLLIGPYSFIIIIFTLHLIHSFMQVHNTTFQIKTVFNNVLFSTEVHNPLHAHLLALSHLQNFRRIDLGPAFYSNKNDSLLFTLFSFGCGYEWVYRVWHRNTLHIYICINLVTSQ